MVPELFLLALASTVRPTSLAAVSALLSSDERRRLMFAYVISGLAFTFVFGVLVVGVFHGIHVHAGSDGTRAASDVVGGIVILLFGVAFLTGVLPRHARTSSREVGNGRMARLDRQITVRVAALAGPLTHLPGIFYLVALNSIVAHSPELPGGVVAVASYDGIWFALPIAALVMCMVDPDAARNVVVSVAEWTRRHSRTVVVSTCSVVGTALLVRGLVSL